MLPDPTLIKGYYVYEYTFLDDLNFIVSPRDYFHNQNLFVFSPEQVDDVVEAVKEKFLKAGWEGDGSIGLIWLPPFVDVGFEDTFGNYLWHVKQDNNGVSFILSEQPLEFERISEQNNDSPFEKEKGTPVSIIHYDVENLRSATEASLVSIKVKIASIATLVDPKVSSSIIDDLLIHNQGMLVRRLNQFFDHCYLRLLIEAINGNRSKIKIKKSRVQLSPGKYIPDDSPDDDSSKWFTLQGIITDMWAAYKLEPYKSRIEMLFKSVDFTWDSESINFLNKHVALRNCVQHHENQLDKGSLDKCGVTQFTIKGQSEDIILGAGKPVIFTLQELEYFCAVLVKLSGDFGKHVLDRVPSRDYVIPT